MFEFSSYQPEKSAFESPSETSPLGSLKPSNPSALSLIRARGKSLIAVCGAQTRDAQHFGAQLVRLGYPKGIGEKMVITFKILNISSFD